MSPIASSPWFVRREVPACGRRLSFFHHAGGNASYYVRWWKWLPHDVDIVGVQLPGRGSRRHEPFATDAPSLIASLLQRHSGGHFFFHDAPDRFVLPMMADSAGTTQRWTGKVPGTVDGEWLALMQASRRFLRVTERGDPGAAEG
ncbi:thioesterase II family protein [Burkholderia sp. YIM B11467]